MERKKEKRQAIGRRKKEKEVRKGRMEKWEGQKVREERKVRKEILER